MGGPDWMTDATGALAFTRKFDNFLKEIPQTTPVIVIADEEPGVIQSQYSSQEGEMKVRPDSR